MEKRIQGMAFGAPRDRNFSARDLPIPRNPRRDRALMGGNYLRKRFRDLLIGSSIARHDRCTLGARKGAPARLILAEASVPMIRAPALDGVGAVNLFEHQNQRHFMLKSQPAKRPFPGGAGDERLGMTIRAANQKRDFFDSRRALPCGKTFSESAAGNFFAVFVQHDPKHSMTPGMQDFAFSFARTGFKKIQLHGIEWTDPVEIFLNAAFCESQLWLPDGENA